MEVNTKIYFAETLQPLRQASFTHQGHVKLALKFVSHCDSATQRPHQILHSKKKVAKPWQKILISVSRFSREQIKFDAMDCVDEIHQYRISYTVAASLTNFPHRLT